MDQLSHTYPFCSVRQTAPLDIGLSANSVRGSSIRCTVDNIFGMMNGVALTYCYIKYNHRTQSRFCKKKHDTTRRYHLLQIKRTAVHRLCLIKLL